jgi:hypothetical protein
MGYPFAAGREIIVGMGKMRWFLGVVVMWAGVAGAWGQSALPAGSPWVFAGFKDNGQDGVYMALSLDGYHWNMANGGKPIVKPTEPDELMRDPFLQRDADDNFVMVWTWAWRGKSIGYATSEDLVHWGPQQQVAVMAGEPTALNTWAPALYWEKLQQRWVIIWSSTVPGRFKGDDSGDDGLNHRIWWTTTKDFKKISKPKVYFDPGYSVIDATVVQTPGVKGGSLHLMFKDERKTPLEKHLLAAAGSDVEGPWGKISEPISEQWAEGAGVVKVPGGWITYYDHYTKPQHYGALFSTDFIGWTDASAKISFPEGMRHGSFLQISREEYEGLARMK